MSTSSAVSAGAFVPSASHHAAGDPKAQPKIEKQAAPTPASSIKAAPSESHLVGFSPDALAYLSQQKRSWSPSGRSRSIGGAPPPSPQSGSTASNSSGTVSSRRDTVPPAAAAAAATSGQASSPPGALASSPARSQRFAPANPTSLLDQRIDIGAGIYYTGSWKDGQPGGWGKFEYPPGHRMQFYRGPVENGKPHALGEKCGLYCFANLDLYYGNVNAGRMEGRAIITYAAGNSYDGETLDGLAHGRGVLTSLSKDTRWEGIWNKGNLEGMGAIFSLDQKQKGKETYSQEKTGIWVDGIWVELNPKDVIVFSTDPSDIIGRKAEGIIEFSGHDRHGEYLYRGEGFPDEQGVEIPDKDDPTKFRKYTAQGFGKFKFANGDVYDGEIHRGHRQGIGKMIIAAGTSIFLGEWHQNMREGQGRFSSGEGWVFKGIWRKDVVDGFGVVTFPDGDEIIGMWTEASLRECVAKKRTTPPALLPSTGSVSAGHHSTVSTSSNNTPRTSSSKQSKSDMDVTRTGAAPSVPQGPNQGSALLATQKSLHPKARCGKVRYDSGTYYVGEVLLVKTNRSYFVPHGWGIYVFFEGGKHLGTYEGPVVRGRPIAKKAKVTFSEGTIFVGEVEGEVIEGMQEVAPFRHTTKPQSERAEFEMVGLQYVGETLHMRPHGMGTIEWENGDKYKGKVETLIMPSNPSPIWQSVPHGQGVCVFKDGRIFEGEFFRGAFVRGTLYNRTLETEYTGEFQNELFHGQGTLRMKDGSRYTGAFCKAQFHGQGTLKKANGDKYTGRFQFGRFDGAGEYYSIEDGSLYVGNWTNGVKKGSVKCIAPNGTVRTEMWEMGRLQALLGPIESSAQSKTEITRARSSAANAIDLPDIRPLYRTIDPEGFYMQHIGERVNGVPHGKGTFKFADGSSYRGEIVHGFPDRFGTYLIAFRQISTKTIYIIYEGEIEQGAFHGYGEMFFSNERICGIWHKNRLVMILLKDCIMGRIVPSKQNHMLGYEGMTFDGKPYGMGTLSRGQERWKGTFLNGLPHGMVEHTRSDGIVMTREWIDGRPMDGLASGTAPGGSRIKVRYLHGLLQGAYELTDAEDSVEEGVYLNNVKHGPYTRKNRQGITVERGNYDNGTKKPAALVAQPHATSSAPQAS